MALFDNIIHKLRFPKFLEIVSEVLGEKVGKEGGKEIGKEVSFMVIVWF